jgi:dTDP-4-dehydrorhamnose reductase
MMHILIVAARGQLGQALHMLYSRQQDLRVTTWNRPAFDITDPNIATAVSQLRPDVVINCAAWTDVDGAEANEDAAYAANALGPKYLAEGCDRCNATLVHISTNMVFAGEAGCFYREYDGRDPRGVYARSKLAGELAVQQRLDRLYIVRVAWLFGVGSENFPAKIIAAADQRGALRVVGDEYGNPTYAPDAAEAIARLVESERFGVYHLVNAGMASRYEFAQTVLQARGRGHIPLTPISYTEWPRPAPAIPHAVIVNQAGAALGITLRPWQEAVQAYAAQA